MVKMAKKFLQVKITSLQYFLYMHYTYPLTSSQRSKKVAWVTLATAASLNRSHCGRSRPPADPKSTRGCSWGIVPPSPSPLDSNLDLVVWLNTGVMMSGWPSRSRSLMVGWERWREEALKEMPVRFTVTTWGERGETQREREKERGGGEL